MKAIRTPSHDERADHLREVRNVKMARSAHAYVRGSTVKFYEWLEASAASVPVGPSVWICGDCHLGNLGPLADTAGRVAIQIRDLDQTVIGNPVHDLIRLGLSLASAARGSDLPGLTTVGIVEQLVAGYDEALQPDAPDEPSAPKRVERLLRTSTRRRWHHLTGERLATVRPIVPLGRRFWALEAHERTAIEALVAAPEVVSLLTHSDERQRSAKSVLVDAAYWMKGCSSLGRLRYAVMLKLGSGKDVSLRLLDVKEATSAAAPRLEAGDESMPRDNAARVVAGARALSPHLGERMMATRLLDRAVVVRELAPQDLKFEIDRLTRTEALAIARYVGGVVGRAHGRQMDADDRGRWSSELGKARSSTLDAPSWLWKSIVELMAIHEAAYLEHCRRYAMAIAA